MNRAHVISQFLRALAWQIEKLDDEEIDDLLQSGGVKGLFSRKLPPSKRRQVDMREVKAEASILMQRLVNRPSRESARELLDTLSPTRRVLIEAAKLREIHVARNDTVASISEKLVENVVGSRLDSARIRGS